MNDLGRLLILGAGPTGLGAGLRCQERGVSDFRVLEASDHPGGLASSYVDREGFTWDVGGHVQFSHYPFYDRVVDRVLGSRRLFHDRESWVWIKDRFVPYPFQHNFHHLDEADRKRALAGLEEASERPASTPPPHFESWIQSTFGSGLAEIFFLPYNRKVWGFPLDSLGIEWTDDRVALPDLELARRLADGEGSAGEATSWGPNRKFYYPLHGGTGSLWSGVAGLLDPDRLEYGARVTAIELGARRVELSDGRSLSYDHVVSSIPLDVLCAICGDLDPESQRAGRSLVHSSCHILGIGLKGVLPEKLHDKCWIYFPESHSPYYRVTVLSRYSPNNVPDDSCWSLMAEVCESPHRPVDESSVAEETLTALRRDGLIDGESRVISLWHRREEHGYPTPFRGRDRALQTIRRGLEAHGVYSRGRFGAWKYEVSNQDHSFMQGVEIVDCLLGLGEETTLENPLEVNRRA